MAQENLGKLDLARACYAKAVETDDPRSTSFGKLWPTWTPRWRQTSSAELRFNPLKDRTSNIEASKVAAGAAWGS